MIIKGELKMKKKLLFATIMVTAIYLFAFCIMSASADTISSGTCGENLTWTLDDSGALTISGSGEMYDWDCDNALYAPWHINASSINAVIVGDRVTSIGSSAFVDCRGILSVIIGKDVENVGKKAFYGCDYLSDVYYCGTEDNWRKISFDSYNLPITNYSTKHYHRENFLDYFSYSVTNGEITITDCDTWIRGEITIPATIDGYAVKYIGDYAFGYCNYLTGITIPDGVISIGKSAFSSCKNLTSITIPGSVRSIGNSAFNSCISLTSVNITEIEAWCGISFDNFASNPLSYAKKLYQNGNLVTHLYIGDGVKNIGQYAFYGCEDLISVTIGENVESIGRYAFFECTGLTQINWNAKNVADFQPNVNNVFGYAGQDDSGINVIFGDNVERVPAYMFHPSNGYVVEGIIIPKITSVVLGENVASIGDYAFYNCSYIKSLSIGKGARNIGNYAFYGCKGLPSVTIPEGVTSIGECAFGFCEGLTSITIPESATNVGGSAFYYCTGLTQINWNAKNVADFSSNSNVFDAAGQSGNGICVIFGDNVETIPMYMFYSYYYRPKIISVTIGENVTSVGSNGFSSCSSLQDVYYNGTEEEWNDVKIGTYNDPLINATIHFNRIEKPSGYRINSVTVKDMSGNELSAIPMGTFLATVSFTNVSSSADTVIILAQYSEAGAFKGLLYIQTEDVPIGSTIKLSVPVDNANGDVAKLKAFCWKSFGLLTPMGNSVSFPEK